MDPRNSTVPALARTLTHERDSRRTPDSRTEKRTNNGWRSAYVYRTRLEGCIGGTGRSKSSAVANEREFKLFWSRLSVK